MVVGLIFAIQLFSLQVLNPDYKSEAFSNVRKRIVEPPVRGMIYSRDTQLIVNNTPVFNIYMVARQLKIRDTLGFCQQFGLSSRELREKLEQARVRRHRRKPVLLVRHMRQDQFNSLVGRLEDFPGISYEATTVREYRNSMMANALGYVREIDKKMLAADSTGYYQQGDLVGYSGLERTYELDLRGQRGVRYVYVDVQQNEKGRFMDGQYDTVAQIGKNLITTIDYDLQFYGEQLMGNKLGSVVAIEPATGEVLAMVSAPSYNPNLLSGNPKEVAQNFGRLVTNRHNPLYNRTIMAPYPPGSVIKIVQALIGLQEGVLDSVTTRFPCSQGLVKCHNHPSPLDLRGSIQHSCNPFYYRAFNRIVTQGAEDPVQALANTRAGLDKWKDYMRRFGLGERLETDLPNLKTGRVPAAEFYDRRFKTTRWKYSNIYSLSIGQGEMGVLPLQMANLAAIMANRGHYITPHLVKYIGQEGSYQPAPAQYRRRHETGIKKEYFEFVVDGMERVITAGTARRAQIKGVRVCGKTGTAQNPHGEDHSVFLAFAPRDNPQIAIAVYVENAGFGGTWAAPIASLMMEKYLKGKVERKPLETQILNKDFVTPKVKINTDSLKKLQAQAQLKIAALDRKNGQAAALSRSGIQPLPLKTTRLEPVKPAPLLVKPAKKEGNGP
jgi:penicillin-binding protein 2